jgi:multidrug transporter EmrE-like cation transporter
MIKWIVPLVILVFFEGCADIVAKYFAITNKTYVAIGALALYVVANIFWLISLKHGVTLATGAVIFSIASEVLAILIGLLLYHEQISLLQGVGIILGIISLVLLVIE